MPEQFHVRPLHCDDATAVCALWDTVLPPQEGRNDLLPKVLSDLIEREAVQGSGIFDRPNGGRCLGFGVSCFLHEDAADAFVASPKPYMNLRLLDDVRRGDFSRVLLPVNIAPRNAGPGLDMFVLEWCQVTYDFEDPRTHQLLNLIVPEYISLHQSFRIRRSFHETEVAKGHIQESGLNRRLFDVAPQHPWSLSEDGGGPRAVYGLTREEALKLPGVGVAKTIFGYTVPRFRFRPREQQILKAALAGGTDVAIADQLGISRDGVRNHWQAIYDHVEDIAPELFGVSAGASDGLLVGKSTRGTEKRRRLLAYLSGQTQELRPYGEPRKATA